MNKKIQWLVVFANEMSIKAVFWEVLSGLSHFWEQISFQNIV